MQRRVLQKTAVLAAVTALVLGALDWQSRADSPQRTTVSKPVPPPERPQRKPAKPDKPREPLLSKFMRAKLKASTQVLEGLCTQDYSLVLKGAKTLETMSAAEKWRVSNDAMYRQYSAEFRRTVGDLRKAADQKKLDSAVLAWTKTTLSCIECHRALKTILISDQPKTKNKQKR